jgi:hypothetical protein
VVKDSAEGFLDTPIILHVIGNKEVVRPAWMSVQQEFIESRPPA